MGGNKKVVKFKKRRSINIGVIVFIIMFVYIAINVYIYFTKDQLSIYEVHTGTTAVDNRITGMILREEKIINTDKTGYVTYYQKEGARIAKKAQVYSINENGQMIDMISSGEADIDLTEKNNDEIRHDLTSFHNNFSDSDFSYVYKFEEEVVHMEKIVVSNRFRRKGVSEALMKEFFNRMKDEGFGFVTTGFLRPEYFLQI